MTPAPSQRRQRVPDVAREIVVEGDRDGKALAATAAADGVQELARRDDAVVPPEMAQLAVEDAVRDGRRGSHVRVAAAPPTRW